MAAARHDLDCHEFLCRLVANDLQEEWFDGLRPLDAQKVKEQLAASYRLFNVKHKQAHDALAGQGVAPQFLTLAAGGNRSFFNFFKKWAGTQLGRSLDAWRVSPKVVDTLMILKEGRKFSLSPWTGTITSSRDSLGPSWYLFREAGMGFIVGLIAKPAVPCHDTVWILPDIKSILFVDMGADSSEVLDSCAELIAELAPRIGELTAHLLAADRRVVVWDFDCDHFGHYVWNVISAWGALFEAAEPETITTIACANTDKFWGRISEIFAPGDQHLIELSLDQDGDVYDRLFNENWLLSSINAHHISSATAQRVVGFSMERCAADFKSRLLTLTREHWPVVLLSLRFENRAWSDQVAGFAELAQRLCIDFPNIAFLIHGLSKGVAMGSTTSWMSLDVERRAAAQLVRTIGAQASVLSAVGLSIHESVAICSLCDLFVAPVGSGMALYKWLTNKPGVSFSNRYCSDPSNHDRWAFTVFEHCRDDIVPSTAMPLAAITDVEPARHGSASRANFTLDRTALHATVRELLSSLAQAASCRRS